jgi:hypothetical protein
MRDFIALFVAAINADDLACWMHREFQNPRSSFKYFMVDSWLENF